MGPCSSIHLSPSLPLPSRMCVTILVSRTPSLTSKQPILFTVDSVNPAKWEGKFPFTPACEVGALHSGSGFELGLPVSTMMYLDVTRRLSSSLIQGSQVLRKCVLTLSCFWHTSLWSRLLSQLLPLTHSERDPLAPRLGHKAMPLWFLSFEKCAFSF